MAARRTQSVIARLRCENTRVRLKGPRELIDQNQKKTGMMEGFIYEGLCTDTMKEENQDPDSVEQSGIKEESEQPYHIDQDYYKTKVKEENLDPDYFSQQNYNSEIKEETTDPGRLDQDNYSIVIKEEIQHVVMEEDQAPDLTNQDQNSSGEKIQDLDVQSSDVSRRSKAGFPPGPDLQDKRFCGICFKTYQNLGQHLNVSHHVCNEKERKLLLAYGSGRVNGNLKCPVCDKDNIVRLDKHLMNYHLYNPKEVELFLLQAKRMLVIKKIADLRASIPTPGLVCSLDKINHDIGHGGTPGLKVTVLKDKGRLAEKFVPVLFHAHKSKPVEEESTTAQRHQPANEAPSTSASIGSHTHVGTIEGTLCSEALDDFHKFTLGSRTSAKHRQNAQSQRSHVVHFMMFMLGQAKDQEAALKSLRFLFNVQKLKQYPEHLKDEGYALVSVKKMLISVSAFFNHMRKVNPIDSKLNGYEISALLYHLKKLQGRETTAMRRQRCSRAKQQRCKDCAALSLRVKRLEETVEKILEEKASILNSRPHPEKSVRKTRISRTKQAVVGHSVDEEVHTHLASFKGTFCGEALDDFHKFTMGSRTSAKHKQNAQSQRSHVVHFMMFMLRQAKDQEAARKSLSFLFNLQQLKEYRQHLKDEGYAPAFVKNMLLSVSTFLNHMRTFHPTRSKLKSYEISALLYHLKKLPSGRIVAVQRQKTKQQTTKNAVSASDELVFMKKATKKIPELLKKLHREVDIGHHHLVMGYVAGYLVIVTGHRPEVFINMCKDDVSDATLSEKGHVVLVEKHKADTECGHVQLALNTEEYKWLSDLVEVSNTTPQYSDCPFVFHSDNGEQLRTLGSFLQAAWEDARLSGNVSFNLIRSTVSTQVDQHLSRKERDEVARSTSLDLSTEELFKIRQLRVKALYEDAVDPETDTTSEDEVAQLQDTDTDELLSDKTETEDEDQGETDETDSNAESRLEKKDNSHCRNSDKTENDRCYKTRKGRVTKRKQPVHTEQPKEKCVKTEKSK